MRARWTVWVLAAALVLPLMGLGAQEAVDAVAPEAVAAETLDEATPVEVPAEEATEEAAVTAEAVLTDTNTLWTCLAAFLVFFMQAGFALVETGFTRAKNAVNIIMKNVMDFSMGSLAFWLIGFGFMFGPSLGGFIGMGDFMPDGLSNEVAGQLDAWETAFWIFQCVFAATAATIVSGAMAERTKFTSYLIYSVVITAFIYPVFGSWAWGGLYHGGGWLEGLGFIDFAGSTVVHSIGGWCALAGAMILGPRIGKYGPDGRPRAIPGHNLPMAALGVFILWLGWFGFNPGSTTAIGGSEFARVAVTTNMAAAAGSVAAMVLAWAMFGKPDMSMTLNGALAGLVGITAGCYNVSPLSSILIGALAGVLVVLAIIFIDHKGIDDPVGAVSVHGVCGAWGTLAAGLFAQEAYGGTNGLLFGGGFGPVVTQLIGIAAAFVWAFGLAYVMFSVIKATVGLRVSEVEELEGLDIGEHGQEAYGPDPVALGGGEGHRSVAMTGD